ncbi:hypothetical protein TNCV_3431601 [Trichonephila clavipes]|nr:hypothetical protein TNCV_3431601 [Trichonephila clavipes]
MATNTQHGKRSSTKQNNGRKEKLSKRDRTAERVHVLRTHAQSYGSLPAVKNGSGSVTIWAAMSLFYTRPIVTLKAGRRAVLLARWIVRSVPLEIFGSSEHEKVPTRGKLGLERLGRPRGERIEGSCDKHLWTPQGLVQRYEQT